MSFPDNNWINWFMSNYSGALAIAPLIAGFMLKLIAIWHPEVPSDKICDLIEKTWRKK